MSASPDRILVAGIGNIFHGDDAFGVEVIRHLLAHYAVPARVRVEDFGIRGYDLAYAIGDGHEAVILVDAAQRGETPGTLSLLELDLAQVDRATELDAHSLDPVAVLKLVRALGASDDIGKLYLVGCEPAVLECEDGSMKLSQAVAAAVPGAVEMIRKHLARHFSISLEPVTRQGPVPVSASAP